MKKLNQYALLSAMMLTGAVGFTACSSDNDPAGDVNIGNGEVVKTQFAINIPYAGKGNTRMSDDIVQGQNPVVFRGMTNIRLTPFALENLSNDAPLIGTELLQYSPIKLGNNADITTNEYTAKIYKDVEIPIKTNAFLFYGEAPKENNTDAENGVLIPSYTTSGTTIGDALNNYTFSLKSILDGTEKMNNVQTLLLNILNTVVNVEADNQKWSDVTEEENKTLYTYYHLLVGKAATADAEAIPGLKAGSAQSILLAMEDLYGAMQSIKDNAIAKAVMDKIDEHFNHKETTTWSYKNTTIGNYPVDLGMPAGSVQVKYSNGIFSYVSLYENTEETGSGSIVEGVNLPAVLKDYVYPSALFYTSNTKIKVDNQSQLDGIQDLTWEAILKKYESNETAVSGSTKSIALISPINYAVSRFDVKAYFKSTNVVDNKGNSVTIPTEGFKLRGVLVGGQKQVNWNFTTNVDASAQTVYDAAVPAKAAIKSQTGNETVLNHTLLLETKKEESIASAEPVNFVLELENSSDVDFEGKDGIVRKGGTFYLVGTLSLKDGYNYVFQQDHVTVATIGIESLKNAYNCIPDLRAPKLELGLSVDLEWQEGLSQDVTID